MRLSLIPKEHDYFRLFSDLAANLDEAAQLLVRFMDDYENAKSIGAVILEHEHVGDHILHDIVQRLNKSFITPIDREDIYALVATMDEVLDNIEEATDSMVLYRVTEPTEYARRQARVIAEAATVLHQLIDDLEKQTDLMERVIIINSLENEGDRIEREAIAALFDDDKDARDIIKWKDVYAALEAAIDECEHVANVIESIVLKHN